ncbi:hypothetical protein P152DRAFT_456120 [Eremomyces bilateralis CBS 781.70]|uniref:Mitochondrial distribution and morphology protein family 31/32 n=1 Tax=Eremomyces bilateralis CBS 781.70 TaxID=1392243 RepID=A0A6G1GAM3_9PEZI|nr:uncharacterized protein P152DRAFT_456120 [Eremomyces bilateralis CBS 781.70]KAF1815083.1 hypothetical protein P152DRAFT_456120 [Eremomyces bilateralis CBS 781.70]
MLRHGLRTVDGGLRRSLVDLTASSSPSPPSYIRSVFSAASQTGSSVHQSLLPISSLKGSKWCYKYPNAPLGISNSFRLLSVSPFSQISPPRAASFTTWNRGLPISTSPHIRFAKGRQKSSTSHEPSNPSHSGTPKADPSPSSQGSPKSTVDSTPTSKPLFERIPHLPHKLHTPTKEELLAAATGFWSRFKIRFKWFSIKSARPFNIDEISGFLSWILVGHFLWILIGTTTFFSLLIFMVNTMFAQETLAKWVGNYLTHSSGVKVVFESAIVPKWNDGVISFKKVFVSRRPGQGRSKVTKGSQDSAVAAAAALAERASGAAQQEEEDTNYTQFDLSIDTVNVTLSFAKWMNGKGLLKDVEMHGIRGVVDRTPVHALEEYVDPRSYKHEHNTGDFELDSFKMEDLLVTVYQPGGFRPFAVSIYSCDCPRLRKQWLFYDFLSANTIHGSFDNSLFTIHPRQTHNYTGAQLNQGRELDGESPWKKHSRIRIDGLNIDHLNRGVEGPFSWIHEGNVDIVADIMFPADDDGSITKVMSDFYDRMEATVTSNGQGNTSDDIDNEAANNHPLIENEDPQRPERFMVIDLRIHLNDVRAAVPLFTKEISYVNNALVRPIVAYINSQKTFIPINCRVVKRADEFDGSWTIFDSGLMDDLSQETYTAFVRNITDDDDARRRRFRKVGIWTLQLAAQALFIGLAGHIA